MTKKDLDLTDTSKAQSLFSIIESRQLIYLTASSNIIQINAVIIALVSWLAFLDTAKIYIKIACIFIISLNFISIYFFMLALRPVNYQHGGDESAQNRKLDNAAKFYSLGWRCTAVSFPLCLLVIIVHVVR